MTRSRRFGPEDSETRTQFIDAAEQVLRENGYEAVSARRIAERAGLKAQLLYYYFQTMDDLMLAVVHRVNKRRTQAFEAALQSERPLHALWAMSIDPSSAALASELTSMAHHREAVRTQIVEAAQEFRQRQTEAVACLLPPSIPNDGDITPGGVVMIAVALARMLVTETSLGMDTCHAEAIAAVEQLLSRLEP
jgi:TetR/AcrR family transcriptional regulator